MDKRRRKWQPTPIFLPGKLHGLMSLVGYSSCDCKESDTTEWLHFTSLTEAEDIRRGGRNTQKNYTKKILMTQITTMVWSLECEVKWALGNITTNKASGGDGIPVELFQNLKDDATKVLYSICQQFSSVQFSHSVVSDSLRPHGLQHARPPCPSPTPGAMY